MASITPSFLSSTSQLHTSLQKSKISQEHLEKRFYAMHLEFIQNSPPASYVEVWKTIFAQLQYNHPDQFEEIVGICLRYGNDQTDWRDVRLACHQAFIEATLKYNWTRDWLAELPEVRPNFWGNNWLMLKGYFQKNGFRTIREGQCWLIAELESDSRWEQYKCATKELVDYLHALPCWQWLNWSLREERLFLKLLFEPSKLLLAEEIGEGVFIDNYSLLVQYFCMRNRISTSHLAFDFLLSPHWVRCHTPLYLKAVEQPPETFSQQFNLQTNETIGDQRSPDPAQEMEDITDEISSPQPTQSSSQLIQSISQPFVAAQAVASSSNRQINRRDLTPSQKTDVHFLDLLGSPENAAKHIFIRKEHPTDANKSGVACHLALLDLYLAPRIKVTPILSQSEIFVPALKKFWEHLITIVQKNENLLIPFFYGLTTLTTSYLSTVTFLEMGAHFLKDKKAYWSRDKNLNPYFNALLSGEWLNQVKESFNYPAMPQLTNYCDKVLTHLETLRKADVSVQALPHSNPSGHHSLLSMSLSHFDGF